MSGNCSWNSDSSDTGRSIIRSVAFVFTSGSCYGSSIGSDSSVSGNNSDISDNDYE